MDYRQAEKYLFGFTDYEKLPGIAYTAANYDLRRMEALLQPLGNPHLGTRTVHIAGTKGKGSTAAFISQALISAGYRVGLFTSPHLYAMTERIKINNTMISEHDFSELVSEITPVVESVNKEAAYGRLTTFEILTAIAFVYFKRNKVDYQVLEVGMGGRLDATNVVEPDVCVITSISLDHTQILGNTVVKIAREKAGIIKPGCTTVVAPQVAGVARVIKQVCQRQHAKLVQVGKDITWSTEGGDLEKQRLTVNGKNGKYELTIPLLGDYQLENASTAVATLEALADTGARISPDNIYEGFRDVTWSGRFQVLSRQPVVIVDGAHNGYSVKKLVKNIRKYFTWENCYVIFGTSSDKDISGMLSELQTLGCKIVITSSSHPRAASITALSEKFRHSQIAPLQAATVAKALYQTLLLASRADLILVTGSLFVAAEAMEYFKK